MKYILWLIPLLMIGCQKVEPINNLDPQHFKSIKKDIKNIVKYQSIDDIIENTQEIKNLQNNYCSYAPENMVRASIIEELLSDDSITSSIASRTNRLLNPTKINPNYKRFLILKSTNPELVESFLSEIHAHEVHRDLSRKTEKLKLAFQSGFDKQTQDDRAAAIAVGVTLICVSTTLQLYLTNNDSLGITEDVVRSVAVEIFSENLSELGN